MQDVWNEIHINQLVSSKSTHTVAIQEVFSDNKCDSSNSPCHIPNMPQHLYLVMEECQGGTLLDKIKEKVCYEEKEARKVCRILLEAVATMHELGIAHCNLKPKKPHVGIPRRQCHHQSH